MFEPCAIAPFYGRLLWLNRDGRNFPGASTESAFMVGAGGHLTWIEPAHRAVVVVRWMDPEHTAGFTRNDRGGAARRSPYFYAAFLTCSTVTAMASV